MTSLTNAVAREDRYLGKSFRQWGDELSSPSAAVRLEAAHTLAKAGPRAVSTIPKLVRALKDPDEKIREAVAAAIAEIGPSCWEGTIGALADLLADEASPAVRAGTAAALGVLADRGLSADDDLAARVNSVLSKAVSDREVTVRQKALWALGRMGPGKARLALGDIVSALADSEASVRVEAAAALGQFGPAAHSALSALVSSFKQDLDLEVRKASISALVNIVNGDDGEVARDLRPALQDENPSIAQAAALMMANVGGAASGAAVPALSQVIQAKDIGTRRQGTAALARIGVEAVEAVPALSKALADADAVVRRNAALALGHVGPKATSSVPALVNIFTSKNELDEVRIVAGEALSRISPAVDIAIPSLLKLLKEESNPHIRQWAVLALGRLDDPEQKGVMPALVSILSEADPDSRLIRYDAAVLLGIQLGPKSPDKVLDVLAAYLQDKEVRVYIGSSPEIRTGNTGSDPSHLKPTFQGDCRYQAAIALSRIGPRANRPDIMNGLREAAKSSDPKVSATAAAALRHIMQ